jgi:glycosyltransferase involved in cell wall biosynthesis
MKITSALRTERHAEQICSLEEEAMAIQTGAQKTVSTRSVPLRVLAPVSIIVPAHNEEHAIAAQVRRIQRVMQTCGWPYQLIVVDDGSTDRTWEQIQRFDANHIRLPENRGYGAALKAGIEAAENELIVIIDADGTYPAEAIPKMLELARDYDMVVGARTGALVCQQRLRQPVLWFLRRLAGYLAGQQIPDLNSGLRVLRKSLVRKYWHLLPQGFSFTTTITLAMLCNGYTVCYWPVDYYKRTGRSKIRARHAWDFLLLIIRTVVCFNPLRVFLPLGGILFLGGMLKFVSDLRVKNLSETAVMGILAAIIIWAVGLLADQIARIGQLSKST